MLWSSSPTQVNRPSRAGQGLDHPVLRAVGVLAFVDQQIAEFGLPAQAGFGIAFQHLQRQADQVVEIDRVEGLQAALVARVQRGDVFLAQALGMLLGLFRAQRQVLHFRNPALRGIQRVLVGARRQQVLDQALLVVAVENGKAAAQADLRAFFLQEFQAERMEGGDREHFRRRIC